MTFGDNLKGIPTIYKGIQMRSKLETKIALFLDGLKILWVYEPRIFLLSNGVYYKPDFYLPELKMWIEVKGDIQEHNKDISKIFVKDNDTELLVISAEQMYWASMKEFSDGHDNLFSEDNEVQLGKCKSCGKYFFCSVIGDWFCRACGIHNGDHDLIGTFHTSWGSLDINFSNINSIQGWLDGAKVSI